MRGKLIFITGAAVGYVLGARAGRKRYEQIRSAASKVWESPGIQHQVGRVEDFAAEKIGEIPGAIFAGIAKAVGARSARSGRAAVTGRPPRTGEASGPGAPAPGGADDTAL